MKYISKHKRWIKEDLHYYYSKFQLYLKQFSSFDKNTRKRNKEYFNILFNEKYSFRDNYKYSIPNGKYYKPVGIIATEMVAKEDIQNLKAGIKRLIINHTSHKYMGGFHSLDDIINGLDRLEDTFSSWSTSINCGRFDFSGISKLNKVVDYFDLKLRNFNSSFIAIEVHIYIAKEKEAELIDFINNDYKDKRGFVGEGLINNSKKSGAKKSKTIFHYNDSDLKSECLNNYLIDIKWELFKKLSRYLPLLIIKKGIVPPSVNIYNTNILPEEDEMGNFFKSVGIHKYNGKFINDKEKLFFETVISRRNNVQNENTDMILLVNEDRYSGLDGYYNFNFYIMSHFEEVYAELYKCYLANILFDEFAQECVKYKLLNNKIKVKKRNLKRLLLLRNHFETGMTFYRKFVNETNWSKEIEKVNSHFKMYETRFGKDQRVLTSLAIVGHNKLKIAINDIEKDIDQKITVIKHIQEYEQEKKNYFINLLMLAISFLTLYLIINPEKAIWISNRVLILRTKILEIIGIVLNIL